MEITENLSNKTKEILLEGNMSLNYITDDDISQIKQFVRSHDDIKIILRNVEDIDLVIIQILHSVKRSSLETKLKVQFDIELPENTEILMQNTGFQKQILK